MEHIDKVYRLHNVLTEARYPIPLEKLRKKLACSKRTMYRLCDFMRDRLNAPLEYDTQANGWHYREDQRGVYSLPGFWLNDQELSALLTMQQLLGSLGPELLQEELAPFKRRIENILGKTTGNTESLGVFMRLLPYNRREHQYDCFQTIASACLQRKQLRVTYHNRSEDQCETRTLSPQMLIYYRDNWYLGAHCHNRDKLHPFSLDRISDAETLATESLPVPKDELEEVFFSTFGIFSGREQAVALLRFTPEAARWVEGVIWHSRQQSEKLADGGFILRVPYSLPTELIGEILRFADGVTVLEPPELRAAVCEKLEKMVANYQKDGEH
ncbi:MAG: WYL domain-containing protein [Gammaproteobacteria bacterium]|nr:WYL domain-containing protein [Gammaproteobacteria bacterium]